MTEKSPMEAQMIRCTYRVTSISVQLVHRFVFSDLAVSKECEVYDLCRADDALNVK